MNIAPYLQEQLPTEIVKNILSFFNLRELTQNRKICRLFDNLAQQLGGIVEIQAITPFGYFVKIDSSLNGVIHITNIPPDEVFREKDKIRAIVIKSMPGKILLGLANKPVTFLRNK